MLSIEISTKWLSAKTIKWCDQNLWRIPNEGRLKTKWQYRVTIYLVLGLTALHFLPNMTFKKATRKQINKRTWYIKYECSKYCRLMSFLVHVHKGTSKVLGGCFLPPCLQNRQSMRSLKCFKRKQALTERCDSTLRQWHLQMTDGSTGNKYTSIVIPLF